MTGQKDLAIILTVRAGSDRLPNKALANVGGRPLIWWIAKRLMLAGNVIIATTENPEDDALQDIAEQMIIPIYRGETDDVVSRMNSAINKFAPDAKYVMRGLGDCPFISPIIVSRATRTLSKMNAEAFAWHLPPNIIQRLVYGSREFPYSKDGWDKIVKNAIGDEREHIDLYFHRNRNRFNIAYHESPPTVYFRDYRLEVDWLEDLELVRRIADEYDVMAELDHVIRYMDINEDISKINRTRVEKTGLSTSYNRYEMRQWFKLMQGVPVMTWDDTILQPVNERAVPIFCSASTCMLGYALDGILYRKNGDRIIGQAKIDCDCGAGRPWGK